MAQAKGIMPRGEEREVLYANPRTCGYFIGAKLQPGIDRAGLEQWLAEVDGLVDALVLREEPEPGKEKGPKVAAVAVGFAPSFFNSNGAPRWSPPIEAPAGFPVSGELSPLRSDVLPGVPAVDADVMFYVASVYEARVDAFISGLSQVTGLEKLSLERGYQRLDETEHFGYRDGVRNVMPRTRRYPVAFVHRDDDGPHLDEPAWAHGGSYMAYLKIRQLPREFEKHDPEQRDAMIGRRTDGTRYDLPGVDPDDEPAEAAVGLPPSSHVRKAGPRGAHDDVQIFRRGLPYMEVDPDGALRVGLHFCSFQASLDQFDVVFNDWCMNARFPVAGAGVDAVLDPARGFTQLEKRGFFFVPPYQEGGLVGALLSASPADSKRKTGRLVVHKRVIDPAAPNNRFERQGFQFQLFDAQNQPVGSPFASDSTGRAVFDGELTIGETYTLREVAAPGGLEVAPVESTFLMDKANKQLQIDNTVTQPNSPYGTIS